MTVDRGRDPERSNDADLTVEERHESVEARTTSPDGDEVTELRADIEETRLEMGETLNELGDRLEPGHLVNEAKQNVRDATVGRVEEAARGISDMVMDTIKRNPIPAAMAGAGLALLWMNRSSGDEQQGQRSRSHAAQDYGYRYDPDTGKRLSDSDSGGIGEAIGQGMARVGETAGQAGGTIGQAAGQAGETIGQAAGQAGETIGRTVGDVGHQLDRFMKASPVAMGAIALGAGAAIGALVPETQVEQEKLGDAGRHVGEAVKRTVDQAAEKAEGSMDEAERSMTASGSRGG